MLNVSYINSVQTWYFTMRYVSWQDGGVLSFSSITPPPPPFATHSCRLCFEKVSSKVKIIWKWIWTKYELNNSALLIGKRHKSGFYPQCVAPSPGGSFSWVDAAPLRRCPHDQRGKWWIDLFHSKHSDWLSNTGGTNNTMAAQLKPGRSHRGCASFCCED